VDADDVALRNLTYRMFVDSGRAPTAAAVAAEVDMTVDVVLDGWARLHDAHALVLQTGGREIRMANPFSAVPSAYRVLANGRWWYANCAWDAFGVCAALRADGTIDTSCADCGDPITIDVADTRPDDPSVLFHCLVPASRWWDDIVFT
jgi:Alkylmercury lyase